MCAFFSFAIFCWQICYTNYNGFVFSINEVTVCLFCWDQPAWLNNYMNSPLSALTTNTYPKAVVITNRQAVSTTEIFNKHISLSFIS